MTLPILLEELASYAGIPALILALVQFFLKRGETHERNEQESKIAALQSSYRLLEDRSRTQFGWLNEKRGAAIIEVNGLVLDLQSRTTRLIATLVHGRPEEQAKTALFIEVESVAHAFRDSYPKAAIFVPTEVFEKLKELDDIFWRQYIAASIHRNQTDDDRTELYNEWLARPETATRTSELNEMFRRLLGAADSRQQPLA